MLIIVTSADIEHPLKDMRTKEYLKTISWIKENDLESNVAWIETVKKKNSFIEEHVPVFYSNSHVSYYNNKGSNWGKAIETFINCMDIHEDYICHLTGRYHFLDTYFFDSIKKNSGYDLYAKNDGHDQYFTGCFAIKTKYMIEWINETDWHYLNFTMTNVEKSLWNFSKVKKMSCYDIDSIHMDCNIFGVGDTVRSVV